MGSKDWQSGSDGVVSFGAITGMPVNVVDRQGHMLSVDHMGRLLDEHLTR